LITLLFASWSVFAADAAKVPGAEKYDIDARACG
jgi:hypothetical protein